jgi:hypothetical protein
VGVFFFGLLWKDSPSSWLLSAPELPIHILVLVLLAPLLLLVFAGDGGCHLSNRRWLKSVVVNVIIVERHPFARPKIKNNKPLPFPVDAL